MFREIKQYLDARNVKLIAVSKTRTVHQILDIYNQGQKNFGENRVQELIQKQPLLPEDIKWHLIGHLQKNKVRYIAPFIFMIHSVDSLELLRTIQKEGEKHSRTIKVLLQFHIADEITKFGLDESEAKSIMDYSNSGEFPNISFCGVMGMATLTEDMDKIRSEFRHLRSLYEWLKTEYFYDSPEFCEISMGMSGDYKIAVEEGTTMVRLGTLLFE